MKKLLLTAAAFAGAIGMSHANTLTVHNLTACSYTLSTSVGTLVMVGPGMTTLSFTPNILATKIVYNILGPNEVSIGVGIPPNTPYANSSSYSFTPPCLTSSYYTCSWSQASVTADATLVIF